LDLPILFAFCRKSQRLYRTIISVTFCRFYISIFLNKKD